ncbi:topology modulation protein [Mammaliicoccus fleurettii]|uniref:topology modulation protein n=1 Tax=Mammaliicoccus fleurettii TaxID=150056 RepID=UPI002DB7A861|nr:topology modulation protein [Mammaliicoccus fleurettii]MEB7779864.1 topology modulation protein [Mammaliicoccus fleurettii]
MYKRIMIIGSPGSGKSTLGHKLHNKIDLPLYHLDEIQWINNKETIDSKLFEKTLNELVERDEWIIDGNYNRTIEVRLKRADLVIWLNYSRTICMFRIFKRLFQSIFINPQGGNPKTISLEFIKFVWNFKDTYEKRLFDLKDKNSDKNEWIILNYKHETKLFYDKLNGS